MNSYASFNAFKPKEGKGAELLSVLAEAARAMETYPGCSEYRVFKDASDAGVIWVFEVWESEEAHAACLKDPVVLEAVGRGMPLIDGVPHQHKLMPIA